MSPSYDNTLRKNTFVPSNFKEVGAVFEMHRRKTHGGVCLERDGWHTLVRAIRKTQLS